MNKHPETANLKRQLKGHYAKQQLNEYQLDQLLQLKSSNHCKQKTLLSSVAACLFIAGCIYLYDMSTHDYSVISKDIAYNHNSKLQMEVVSTQLQTVQGHLNKLDFKLVNSRKIQRDNLQLIGGRYCNINGKIAAQMQLRHNKTQTIYTFYQANVEKDFIDNLSNDEMAIDGVKVKLWREKGLLMGLAF
jgi:hypothetical protein